MRFGLAVQLGSVITMLSGLGEVRAAALFEGYYRIERDKKHIGYLIQRLDEDPRSSIKTLTSFVHIVRDGRVIEKTLRTRARSGSGNSVSSDFVSNESGEPVRVSAKFSSGGQPTATFTNLKSGRTSRKLRSYPSSVASAFLYYMTDFGSVRRNTNYSYFAYSEDNGRTTTGTLRLVGDASVGSRRVVHVINQFAGAPVESFVDMDGAPVGSRLATLNLVAYWVKDRAAAVGHHEFPVAKIRAQFGAVPEGRLNPWAGIPHFRADEMIGSFSRADLSRMPTAMPRVQPPTLPRRKL